PVAELRAGPECRPPRGTAAAAPEGAAEEARCGRRDAMQPLFNVPGTGPRVSSSAKLASPSGQESATSQLPRPYRTAPLARTQSMTTPHLSCKTVLYSYGRRQ